MKNRTDKLKNAYRLRPLAIYTIAKSTLQVSFLQVEKAKRENFHFARKEVDTREICFD